MSSNDTLPEWLMGQIRNLLGFARAGSNPACVVDFLAFILRLKQLSLKFLYICSTYKLIRSPKRVMRNNLDCLSFR